MKTPDPSEVRKLIDDIEDAESALAVLKARWDSLFVIVPSITPPGRKADPTGIASRVLAVLNERPEEVFDSAELASELGVERKSIEGAFYNLFQAKKIEKARRGNYRAVQRGDHVA
jgi:hypothetical protein